MAINRSREGLGCEPMGPYSKKSTYQGSVYLLIWVQEGAEAVFVETGGPNFEKFAVQPAGRPAGRLASQLAGWLAGRLAGRPAKNGPKPAETVQPAGQNRPKTAEIRRNPGRSRVRWVSFA